MSVFAGHVRRAIPRLSALTVLHQLPYCENPVTSSSLLRHVNGVEKRSDISVVYPVVHPMKLPTKHKSMVYSFPTLQRNSARLPGELMQEFMEKFDPLPLYQVPLEAPQRSPAVEKFTGERMLRIRRHKMRKHKRRKRYDRDYYLYQKKHQKKKLRAETEFRSRLNEMIQEYKSFDPEKYVRSVIAKAKQDIGNDMAPSGKRKYPHWSTLITLEELFGLPQYDYIDKKAGLPSDEDLEKMESMKKEYDEKYRGFLSKKANNITENKDNAGETSKSTNN